MEKRGDEENKIKGGEDVETGLEGMDLEGEYKESFQQALLTKKYTETALDYIMNMNPVERVLKDLENTNDAIKKDATDRVQAQMQEWLGMFEDTLKAGRTLPVDLIGRAADIAKQRRGK